MDMAEYFVNTELKHQHIHIPCYLDICSVDNVLLLIKAASGSQIGFVYINRTLLCTVNPKCLAH